MVADIEQLFKTIEERDTRLSERLAPLEAALAKTAETDATLESQRKNIEDLTKTFADTETAMDDLRKLVKAYQSDIYTPRDYKGVWPTREAAKRFGLFIMGHIGGNADCKQALENCGVQVKALAESATSTGGALVPEEFHPQLIELMQSYGKFRANAQVVPLGSETATWPKLDADVTGYVPGEAGTITASNPTFSNVALVAKKFAALCAISSELAADAAVAVGEIVGRSIARKFAYMEDQAGFLGDGTSTYWGITGLAGAFTAHPSFSGRSAATAYGGLVNATGNADSELVFADLLRMVGSLPDFADTGCKWYMNRYWYYNVIWPLIAGLSSSNRSSIGTIAEGYSAPQKMLLGYPVELVSVLPSAMATDTFSAYLGDLSQGAYMGNRATLAIEQDRSVYFASDQIAVRGLERVAFNVFGIGDASNAGPICALSGHSA